MASILARPAGRLARLLLALALPAALPSSALASCLASGRAASLEEIVDRVQAEDLKYVFVGERHGVGPVKRFAVDLANALAERGSDVGLYVEGFRVGCPPGDRSCPSLARLFNEPAFLTLAGESRAPVHAIDPVERDRRASRMAATVARGVESVRVVLVGRAHVIHAEDSAAELWVYGGTVRYPDPGDLVEVFPRREYLTVGLETAGVGGEPYVLRADGCAVDYVLDAPDTREYWSEKSRAQAVTSSESLPAGSAEPSGPPRAVVSSGAGSAGE
jgi:hypothetical protein